MENINKVDEIFQQALKNHKEKNYDIAEDLYKQVLNIEANNINTIFSFDSIMFKRIFALCLIL